MANPIQFIKEVKSELSKVVWPSRNEVVRITLTVIVFSAVVAVFLGLVDYGLSQGLQQIINK